MLFHYFSFYHNVYHKIKLINTNGFTPISSFAIIFVDSPILFYYSCQIFIIFFDTILT